jgi:hypothetical protein
MDIMKDYLKHVKLPIIALIALFIVQAILITSINLFTDLSKDPQIEVLVVGGIYFAFTICVWEIIAWAGIRIARTEKAVGSELIDGAIGGAMTAVIAGLIAGIISLLFSVSTLPVLISSSSQPSGAAATAIVGFISILVGVAGIIVGFFINLITGAIFGGLGGLVHKRRLLEQMGKY